METITLAEVSWILQLCPMSLYAAGAAGAFTVTTTPKNARVVDEEAVKCIVALAQEGAFEERLTAVRHPDGLQHLVE